MLLESPLGPQSLTMPAYAHDADEMFAAAALLLSVATMGMLQAWYLRWQEMGSDAPGSDDDDATNQPRKHSLAFSGGEKDAANPAGPDSGAALEEAGSGGPSTVYYCPSCGAAYVDDAGCDFCGDVKLTLTPPPEDSLGEYAAAITAYSLENAELYRIQLEAEGIPVRIKNHSGIVYGAGLGAMEKRDVTVPTNCLPHARSILAEPLGLDGADD